MGRQAGAVRVDRTGRGTTADDAGGACGCRRRSRHRSPGGTGLGRQPRYGRHGSALMQVRWTSRAYDALTRLYRSEEPTSELQTLMRTSYAVFCLQKKKYI